MLAGTMKPGMDEMRLVDGACIVDALVEAPAERIIAAFGKPVKLAEGGRTLVDKPIADVVFYAAAVPGLNWSVIEAVPAEDEPPDHIITMLRQAEAALRGEVLDLPLSYENGLGAARTAAKALKARAVCVWGSDEWRGLGGGALLDPGGAVLRACNVFDPAAIRRELEARQRMLDGEEDDDAEETADSGALALFSAGKGLTSVSGEVIPFLDGWFKELGAAQPKSPPSLWGVWEDFGDVWGARR